MDENDSKFEDTSLLKRICLIFKGIDKPTWTTEYKIARLELQRMVAPLIAAIGPLMLFVILSVVTAVTYMPKDNDIPRINIPDNDDTAEVLETPEVEVETIDVEIDEVPEIVVDVPLAEPTKLPPSNVQTPSQHQSVKPADVDAVAMVKSPVSMKNINSGRNPGTIGGLTNGRSSNYGDPTTEATVMKVLWWLKAHQNTDGSWGKDNAVANTALGVLTYLAHGEYPGSASPYTRDFGPVVKLALEYIVNSMYVDASDTPHFNLSDGNEYSFLLGTYALCEAYGMTKNPNCKDAATKCLERIIKNQSSTGGWDYKLNKNSTRDDLSYAGWAIQALKAGKMAKLHPDGIETAINKAVNCLKKRNYSKSGGFTYTPTNGNNGGNTGLAGVGALAMQLLGRGNENEVRNALDIMADWTPSFDADKMSKKNAGACPQYYCYYATQCKYQAGMKPGAVKTDEELWVKWNGAMKKLYPSTIIDLPDAVIDTNGKPHKQGYFENRDVHTSRPYMDTCLAALQLMVYYRYLPTTSIATDDDKQETGTCNTDDVDVKVDL